MKLEIRQNVLIIGCILYVRVRIFGCILYCLFLVLR